MSEIALTSKPYGSCDVLVVGGGSAGVAAAVAASRSGAKTFLIEKNTFLGGMATGALVTPMMKNALDSATLLTKGIFLEVCQRLADASGGGRFNDGNPGWFNPEIYKIVLDEICMESGVELIFNSCLIYANLIEENKKQKIKDIHFFNKEGLSFINAKQYIDCSGDGDLILLSGVSHEDGADGSRQSMSLRFMMSNVNLDEFASWLEKNDKSSDSPVYRLEDGNILLSSAFTLERDWALKPFFESAIKNGDLKKEDAAYFQVFSIPGSPGFLAFNCPRITFNNKVLSPLKNSDLSLVLTEGRQMIKRISRFCIKYLPGFKNAYISQIASNIGVRESRRLKGQYVLSGDDVLSGQKFDDAIAKSNWPIDIHPSKIGEKGILRHPPKNDYYEIPLRSLLPMENEANNLIVAGRCLSSTFEAQGSARIQPNCFAMGEAAGKLAAMRLY